MRTFKWTVPEFGPSAAERKERKRSEPPKARALDIAYKPADRWERHALKKIENYQSWWGIFPTTLIALIFTWICSDQIEEYWIPLMFFWLFALSTLVDIIHSRALKRILENLSRKSEPVEDGNG